MLLNLSNHPYSQWSEKQKETALNDYGVVKDMEFPLIDPEYTTEQVKSLAKEYFNKIISEVENQKNKSKKIFAVHLQGEFTFVFHLLLLLKEKNIACVASTSVRNVKQIGEKKIINFNFVQFRSYY